MQVPHGPAKLVPLKPEELDNEFRLDLNVVVVEKYGWRYRPYSANMALSTRMRF